MLKNLSNHLQLNAYNAQHMVKHVSRDNYDTGYLYMYTIAIAGHCRREFKMVK